MKYMETLKIITQGRDLKFSLQSSQAPRTGAHGCCVKTGAAPGGHSVQDAGSFCIAL